MASQKRRARSSGTATYACGAKSCVSGDLDIDGNSQNGTVSGFAKLSDCSGVSEV